MADQLSQAIDERYGFPTGLGHEVADAEPLLRLLGRRTVRSYTAQPVPDDLLDVLLACAQSAPTKSDLQQYSIIVVRAAEARRQIAGWLPAMPWVGGAPLFLVFCADMRRGQRVCDLRERPHANDNLDTFFNCTVDAALALGSFIHAAEAVGLGCCPISNVRNHLEPMTALLGLPPGVTPIAGLCVGWPADPGRVSMRLPAALVVHRDRYDDAALADELAAYDRRRHAREPIPPAKQRNADTYGTSPECPWSDQISRQLSRPERADFRALLERHGFALA